MVVNDPTFVRVSLQREGITTKEVEFQEVRRNVVVRG